MSSIQLAMSEAVKQPAESELHPQVEAPSDGKGAAEVPTSVQAAAEVRKDEYVAMKVLRRFSCMRSVCCCRTQTARTKASPAMQALQLTVGSTAFLLPCNVLLQCHLNMYSM